MNSTDNQWHQAAHLVLASAAVGLSELESMSINNGVGDRDNCKREDNFPLTYRAALLTRLLSDDVLLDMMMIVKKERRTVQWLCEFTPSLSVFPTT